MTYRQACELVHHFRLYADRARVAPSTSTIVAFGTFAQDYCAARGLPLGALIEALRQVVEADGSPRRHRLH
ncbi:MAG TPA: hypothetical protein VIT62_10005 [Lysobacter sp.]